MSTSDPSKPKKYPSRDNTQSGHTIYVPITECGYYLASDIDPIIEERDQLRAELEAHRASELFEFSMAREERDRLSDALSAAEDALPEGYRVDREHNLAECIEALSKECDARLRRARSAEMLVRPAQNLNGVPDKTKSDEWNLGYRQRQREEWSRALTAEQICREMRADIAWCLAELQEVLNLEGWLPDHDGDKSRFTNMLAQYEDVIETHRVVLQAKENPQ